MDSISDKNNQNDKKDILNHETANTKMNNSYTSNTYGSLNEDGIPRVVSSSAEQIMEEITPNDQNINTQREDISFLETPEEKRYRKISLYICFATSFFNSTGFGMLNISLWPYMNKVCVDLNHEYGC